MSEFENNGVVCLCGKQRYHVEYMRQVKAKFCLVFSVGRFTCKERVMFFEREIRLLFCVNKWCFLTYKHLMRQSSMASHETFMRLS